MKTDTSTTTSSDGTQAYVLMDTQTGIPVWVLYTKDDADRLAQGITGSHPETKVFETPLA